MSASQFTASVSVFMLSRTLNLVFRAQTPGTGILVRHGTGASAASRNAAIIRGKRGRPTSAGAQPVRFVCVVFTGVLLPFRGGMEIGG